VAGCTQLAATSSTKGPCPRLRAQDVAAQEEQAQHLACREMGGLEAGERQVVVARGPSPPLLPNTSVGDVDAAAWSSTME